MYQTSNQAIDFVNANSSNHNNSISVHVNTNDVSGKAGTTSNAKKSRSEKQCNNESDREENLVIRLSRLEAEIIYSSCRARCRSFSWGIHVMFL